MKKLLFLFSFLICSFGVFASNGITELEKTEITVELTFLEDDAPNLVIIIIEGEGYFAYDDGYPNCLTVIEIDGYLADDPRQVGSDCP